MLGALDNAALVGTFARPTNYVLQAGCDLPRRIVMCCFDTARLGDLSTPSFLCRQATPTHGGDGAPGLSRQKWQLQRSQAAPVHW